MGKPQPSHGKQAPPIIFGEDQTGPGSLFWTFAIGFVVLVFLALGLSRSRSADEVQLREKVVDQRILGRVPQYLGHLGPSRTGGSAKSSGHETNPFRLSYGP